MTNILRVGTQKINSSSVGFGSGTRIHPFFFFSFESIEPLEGP